MLDRIKELRDAALEIGIHLYEGTPENEKVEGIHLINPSLKQISTAVSDQFWALKNQPIFVHHVQRASLPHLEKLIARSDLDPIIEAWKD